MNYRALIVSTYLGVPWFCVRLLQPEKSPKVGVCVEVLFGTTRAADKRRLNVNGNNYGQKADDSCSCGLGESPLEGTTDNTTYRHTNPASYNVKSLTTTGKDYPHQLRHRPSCPTIAYLVLKFRYNTKHSTYNDIYNNISLSGRIILKQACTLPSTGNYFL